MHHAMTAPGRMANLSKTDGSVAGEGTHTYSRSHQYKNESPAQGVSASLAINDSVLPGDITTSDEEDAYQTPSCKTESSGEGSTDTETSNDTMTGPIATPVRTTPLAVTLTESTLGQHQMHHSTVHPVFGWLAQNGPCDRVVYHCVPSLPNSMLAAGDSTSRHSTKSSTSLDFAPAPPSRSITHDIREIGAWCRRLERK